ncbi:MAG TPA: murein L,D-transpeptidase, partial [Methylophaga sp.]|nr:murein L,D-transpeptidase [Methylophaga sp.]
YLAANRLRVLDQDGRELNPATIDWQNPGSIKLRQDPGPNNALGLVVIRFPNPFFVYLHDTPSQSLFASHRRTYSSGCVRV